MSYTPQNTSIYLEAFAGAIAGMRASNNFILDPNAADYSSPARMADAFAQEVDTIFGSATPTGLELLSLMNVSAGVWATRSPLESAAAFLPASYNAIARGVVALVLEGNAQVIAEGIDPDDTGLGGGGATGQIPLGFTALFLNAITGVDTNPGTALAPIKSIPRLNQLIFDRVMTADTTITFQVDDTSGVAPNWVTLASAGFTLTVNGTRVNLHTGGTLNAGTTTINPTAPGGGQRQTAHTSDLADFGPFVPPAKGGTATFGARIRDTVSGGGAWLMSGNGSATASCARPIKDDGTAGALTSGHAYVIERPSQLTISEGIPSGGGPVVYNDIAFSATSHFPASQRVTFNRCSAVPVFDGAGVWNDGDLLQGTFTEGVFTISSGGWYSFDSVAGSGTIFVQGDVYVTAGNSDDGLFVGPTNIPNLVVQSNGIGTGMQIQDCTTPAALGIEAGGNTFVESLIWGNGNTGVGVGLGSGATFASGGITVGVDVPSVTGASGDIAFETPGALVQVARAMVNGQYTEAGGAATRATTWANYAAATGGGGFNFGMHVPEQNSHIVAPTQ